MAERRWLALPLAALLLWASAPLAHAAGQPVAVIVPIETRRVLDALTLIVLATTVLISSTRRLRDTVWLLVAQSVAMAMIGLVVGIVSGVHEIFLSVAITLLVKAIAVPLILFSVIRRLAAQREAAMFFSPRTVTLLSLSLMVASYALVRPIPITGTLITGSYFPTSVAVLLNGLLIMIVRRKAIVQVIGLIVMENGLYLAAMAITFGLPPIIELGITFDLIVSVILLGFFIYQINLVLDSSTDTNRLRQLQK